MTITKNCLHCNKEIITYPCLKERKKFCSRLCRKNHHGGWYIKDGYKLIYVGATAMNSNGYMGEHRAIAEKVLGRTLRNNEHVHHINGDKLDNRNKNLLICTNHYHRWLHERMGELYQKLMLSGL